MQATPPANLQKSDANPEGLPVEAYTYDAVHNRTTSAHQPGAWAYDQNSQLLGFGTEDNKTTYIYNALGHRAKETVTQNGDTTKERSHIYNAAKRLIEVKDGNRTIAQYQYDPFGRRIGKTVNGQTTYFLYTDEGLIAEYDNKTLTKTYGWKPQGMWGSEPLWQIDATGSKKTYYVHQDNLGTSQRLTDKDGKQSWAMLSEAFGKETILSASTTQNNLRFPGQYYDQETMLHYNFFRDYDPGTGRYSESDLIGLRGGANLYIYPQNPILDYDFLGLMKYTSKIIQEYGVDPNPRVQASTGYVNVDLDAKCVQTGCGKWTLDEFIANADILVTLLPPGSPRYSGDCTMLSAIFSENQHVVDLLLGIAESRKQLQETENRLKGIEYDSQSSCELEAKIAGNPSFYDPLILASRWSKTRWDESESHLCNPTNQK